MTKQRRARLAKSQSVMVPRPSEPPPANQSHAGEISRPSIDALGRKQCPTCGERYPASFRVCPRDAIELQEDVGDEDGLLGTVLADTYEIIRVIGEGAAGRVYEARHSRLFSKRFAIKVLHGDLTRQPEVVRRFLREAEATSALQHPNIMGVLDINTVPDGRPYIVAELLQGEQLGDYLERHGKLSVAAAVAICRPICRALIAAHDKHIIHRDIKPENVFVVGKGSQLTVKVLDFGISRVGNAAGNLTKTGMVMGTPAYMPPEQARGQRVDHRADIYAVGTILYEAVTGKRPFDDDDPVGTLAAVLTSDPPRPRSLEPNIPAGLELVIQKAMSKQPSDRYQTMRELDRALAEFDQPDVVAPASAAGPRASQLGRASLAEFNLRDTWLQFLKGQASAPDQARARLAALSVAAGACGFAALADFITSSLRLLRPGTPLTSTELTLTAAASAALVIACGIAWARHLGSQVWASTPRVLEVLGRTRLILGVCLMTYAASILAVRLFDGALVSDARGAAWPGWAVIAIALTSVAGAAASWVVQRLRKPTS